MLQKMQLQTPDGVMEYFFVPDGAALQAARTAGEIRPGMDIVYRQHLVYVLDDYALLVLDTIGGMGMPMYGW